jgi:hypothetical protein
VQHELMARTSIDVAYFRRAYGNFAVTDDRALAPADFDTFQINAPTDARLAGGGGYSISGLYNLKPEVFGRPADRFITRSQNYGTQIERWQGVDVNLNLRPRGGLLVQGGVSTGSTLTDVCEIVAKVPEMLLGASTLNVNNANVWTPAQYCRQQSPFLTSVKFVTSYAIPRIDVRASGTFRSVSGPLVFANFVANNAVVSPSLGRPLAGGAANITVLATEPGDYYGERYNQLDLRLGKLLRFGRVRTTVNLDLYNVLNANTVLTQNNTYGAAWQRPNSILLARFAKIGAQFDF